MIGRAADVPLPDTFQKRLASPLAAVAGAAADYTQECGAALMARRAPPPLGGFESAIDGFEAEMAALRSEGFTKDLPVESVERVFAIGFALDQLRQNLKDLGQRVADFTK